MRSTSTRRPAGGDSPVPRTRCSTAGPLWSPTAPSCRSTKAPGCSAPRSRSVSVSASTSTHTTTTATPTGLDRCRRGPPSRSWPTEFARLVIRHQPLDVTWAALKDFFKGFAPTRTTSPDDVPLERWQFQTTLPEPVGPEHRQGRGEVGRVGAAREPRAGRDPAGLPAERRLHVRPRARDLCADRTGRCGRARSGQDVWTPVCCSAARGRGCDPAAGFCGLRVLLAVPVARAGAVPAGRGDRACARCSARTRRGRRWRTTRTHVDSQALEDFRSSTVTFAPLVVVIAAYNEAGGIGPVLANMPQHLRGAAGRRTGRGGRRDGRHRRDRCREQGAFVCVAPRNRGQGAALRLGLSPRCRGRSGVRRDYGRGRAVRQRRARRAAGADPARAGRLRHRVTPAGEPRTRTAGCAGSACGFSPTWRRS